MLISILVSILWGLATKFFEHFYVGYTVTNVCASPRKIQHGSPDCFSERLGSGDKNSKVLGDLVTCNDFNYHAPGGQKIYK